MEKKTESYAELLKDPRWQKKRLEIMQRDNFTCQLCGDQERQMHVHHKYYLDGKRPWEYSNNVLVTLCENCHNYIHNNIPTNDIGMKIGDVFELEYSDYYKYGIVYFIDYKKEDICLLTVDSGAGFCDCIIEHHWPSELMKGVKQDEKILLGDNYFANSLFYCFYGLLKGTDKVNLDYYKREYGIDQLMNLKYNADEMMWNNQSLFNCYLTAENGNLDFIDF